MYWYWLLWKMHSNCGDFISECISLSCFTYLALIALLCMRMALDRTRGKVSTQSCPVALIALLCMRMEPS